MMLVWYCSICDKVITEPEVPHTDVITDEDVCEACCTYCSTGQRDADQDQYIKEHRTSMNVGDPVHGHGVLTREQLTGRS